MLQANKGRLIGTDVAVERGGATQRGFHTMSSPFADGILFNIYGKACSMRSTP